MAFVLEDVKEINIAKPNGKGWTGRWKKITELSILESISHNEKEFQKRRGMSLATVVLKQKNTSLLSTRFCCSSPL